LTYVKDVLLSPEYEQYTIAAIAELSGFNNKATFYKVFKEKYKLTPSEYIKQHH